MTVQWSEPEGNLQASHLSLWSRIIQAINRKCVYCCGRDIQKALSLDWPLIWYWTMGLLRVKKFLSWNHEEVGLQQVHQNVSCRSSHGYSLCNTLFPGGVLTNITHPAEDKQKPVDPKAKPKIDKHEDAPLMDNEYRLGRTSISSPFYVNTGFQNQDVLMLHILCCVTFA